MKNIKIGSWNLDNGSFNLKANDKKVDAVINLLLSEDLDILALQGVNISLIKKIEDRLKYLRDGYTIGPSVKKYLNPINNLKIEHNIIISRLMNGSINMTTILPAVSKKRISLVTQEIGYDFMLNVTNLDLSGKKVKRAQLNKVIEEIEMEKVLTDNVVLVGSFSNGLDDDGISELDNKLSQQGLMIIPDSKSLIERKEEFMNCIAIPQNWEVESVNSVLYNFDWMSFHNPIVAEVTKKLEYKY